MKPPTTATGVMVGDLPLNDRNSQSIYRLKNLPNISYFSELLPASLFLPSKE